MVTGPMLVRRLRGGWPKEGHGPHFSLGRWGLAVNVVAVLYGAAMIVNLAWPRAAVYGNDHWYYQWGAVVFTGVITAVGGLLYLRYRHHGTAQGPAAALTLVPEDAPTDS